MGSGLLFRVKSLGLYSKPPRNLLQNLDPFAKELGSEKAVPPALNRLQGFGFIGFIRVYRVYRAYRAYRVYRVYSSSLASLRK